MKSNPPRQSSIAHALKLLLKIYLGLLLILILVWVIILGKHVVHLVTLYKSLPANLSQVQVDQLVPMVSQASSDIHAIDSQVRPLFPIFNAFDWVPWLGSYLGQGEPLLTYADSLSQAGNEIVQGLAPLLQDPPPAQSSLSLPERASQVLSDGHDNFVAAAAAIQRARDVRSKIRTDLLSTSIRKQFLKLDERFNLLVAASQLLQAAPGLLGADQAQNYLVLAQNRDELRATGGFISGIGLVTVQNGKILQFSLGDSYAIDDFTKPYPAPPEALHRFMLADYWVPRDANWSPDFPTTAKQAQSLYTMSTGVKTQGVIAFNQIALQRMLDVLGPLQVPGTDEPITAANVENYMRQAWAPEPQEGLSQEWWLHRKDFMQQLGIVMLDRALKSGDQAQLLAMGKTIMDLLDQGQLLLYFNDRPAESALEQGRWNGALSPGNSDYLYLIDSNVGFNKVDTVVQREVSYQVDLSNMSHPTGKVTLTYRHTATGDVPCKQVASYGNGTYIDMQRRCYLDYWRVYTPSTSTLLASTAQPVPADMLLNGVSWSGQVESLPGEASTQVFAGLLMLPLSQSSQVDLTYSLPITIVQPIAPYQLEYRLRLQAQPGLSGLLFHLEVKLPGNVRLEAPGEGWKSDSPGTWSWQGVVDRSIDFNLILVTQN